MKLKIIKKQTADDMELLTLSGEMNIYSIVKLKEVLLKELKMFRGLVIDLAEVSDADSSGFQLLLFLKREAARDDKTLQLTNVCGRIESISSLYGAGSFLEV